MVAVASTNDRAERVPQEHHKVLGLSADSAVLHGKKETR